MAGSIAAILAFKCSVWSICTGTWPHYILRQSIFVWYHALNNELPESWNLSEIWRKQNEKAVLHQRTKKYSSKNNPHCATHLPKKKKTYFAHTAPLAQLIQIVKNYTVSVLSSVFINSKISCWFVYDRKIMNKTLILSKCILISCVTIHSCKLWMLSGV